MNKKDLRRLNRATHRDLGYFCSSLIIVYALSGLALNHVDDWNPDLIVHKETVQIPDALRQGELTPERVRALSELVGQSEYKVFDVPSPGRVKIYYEDASLHLRFDEGVGKYEAVRRRPVFYEVNFLHRNSFKPWRWASDVFAVFLITINITGLLLLKGKQGLGGRGKWWVLAGAIPPAVVLLLELS